MKTCCRRFFVWFREAFFLLVLPCFFHSLPKCAACPGLPFYFILFYPLGLSHRTQVLEFGAVGGLFSHWYALWLPSAVLQMLLFSPRKTQLLSIPKHVSWRNNSSWFDVCGAQNVISSTFPMPALISLYLAESGCHFWKYLIEFR